MSRIEISTQPYERSHGAKPRGRGSWAFCPRQNYDAANYLDFVWWAPAGLTFAEAKKAACKHFAAQVGTNVEVSQARRVVHVHVDRLAGTRQRVVVVCP